MEQDYFYEVAKGHGLRHNPLKAIIAPRPIAWISSISENGVANLAPYSFFNMINDRPPMLVFCSNGAKDTVRNIQETGDFVVNIPTHSQAAQLNETSVAYAPDVDEFEVVKLEREAARLVAPHRVRGAAAALECSSVEIIQLRDHDGSAINSWLVIGRILAVHISRQLINDGTYDTAKANPILRAGYADEYWAIDIHGKFSMRRPG